MRFDSEFETLIGWIEGHMTFFWRILENNTSRTMTNHDETMTVKHHEPWQNHDETMTVKHHDTSWHITNHDDTSRHITNHDETSRHITTDHETSWNIMNHYKAPLIITICTKIIVNYPEKNVLQHEYILFPYNIYLYQKIDRPGFA